MDILREAVKIINERFPLDSEFEIYERETLCSITKKKWEKAYIRENADPDDYSKAYSHAGSSNSSSGEDSEMEWMAKYKPNLKNMLIFQKFPWIHILWKTKL